MLKGKVAGTPLDADDRKRLTSAQVEALEPLINQLNAELQKQESTRWHVVAKKEAILQKQNGVEIYSIDAPSTEEIAAASDAMGSILKDVPGDLQPLAREQLQRVYDEYMQFPEPHRIVALSKSKPDNVIMAQDMHATDFSGVTVDGIAGIKFIRPLSTDPKAWRYWGRRYGYLSHLK